MKRYRRLAKLVAFVKPKQIVEVGTHKADRAQLMCREALRHSDNLHYVGYDLFEDATDETNKREMNGKGAGSQAAAIEILEAIKSYHPGFTYELVKGDTRNTLHGTQTQADFAFIDGGHSVETIAGDYEALKLSRVIVFDDYYSNTEITNWFGCNRVLADIPHEIMPEVDYMVGIGVQLATVGYSSKWEGAINRVCKTDGHKNFTLWRGGSAIRSDLICAINTLELEPDIDAVLENIRFLAKKRLFFVIKADAARSLSYWRTKLERYFQVLEWMAPNGDEVVGTGMPLNLVGEWNAKGVTSDNDRFENTKANCLITTNRIRPYNDAEGNLAAHDRRAIIVGYGPSLRETWTSILGEKKICADEADIITMSGSHDFLIRRDIIPDYHVECDPRPHKALNITRPNDETKYYIASCCHPKLIDKLKNRDLWLWHLLNGEASYRIGEEIESEANEVMIAGGGSVGLRAIALFYTLGYRKFSIYGMDCSFAQAKDGSPVDKKDEDVMRWAGAHKGKKKSVIKVRCGDKWFLTSPVDVTYTRHFVDTVQRSDGADFTLFGNGLLQEMVKLMHERKENAA